MTNDGDMSHPVTRGELLEELERFGERLDTKLVLLEERLEQKLETKLEEKLEQKLEHKRCRR